MGLDAAESKTIKTIVQICERPPTLGQYIHAYKNNNIGIVMKIFAKAMLSAMVAATASVACCKLYIIKYLMKFSTFSSGLRNFGDLELSAKANKRK